MLTIRMAKGKKTQHTRSSDQNIDRQPFGAITGKPVFTRHVLAFGLLAFSDSFDLSGIIGGQRRVKVSVSTIGAGFWVRGVDILLRLIHFCTVVADVTVDVDGC